MRERIIYEEDLNGNVIRLKGRVHRASRELEDFDTRMVNELHRQECEKGSKFSIPGFTANQLQQAWPRQ